jgi:DNA-directed RNA polymerase subunit L
MTSNITKKVIEDLIASDKKGLKEYGVTIDREDYTLRDWLQEAYEETCDTAKYLKAAIEKIDKQNKKNDRKSKT